MANSFDHLLGLNARSALAILQGYGITDVRVTLTGAPSMDAKRVPACVPVENKRSSVLAAIGKQFSVGEEEDEAFDPRIDDSLEEGMLVESRVVAVREDGKQLIVARFHTGEPKPCPIDTPDA